MKIYELTLTQKRGWRYERQEHTLHISKAVAERYAKAKIEHGVQEGIYDEESKRWYSINIPYYEDYNIHELEVNEE